MKFWKCDQCGVELVSEPEVTLNGVGGMAGGILLPERYKEKHFCRPQCFYVWAQINQPNAGLQGKR